MTDKIKIRNIDRAWDKIFETYLLNEHDFDISPYSITSEQIKLATREFGKTSEKEVRILCKRDTRQSRPLVFQHNDLFILPTRNGIYSIIKGEGYIDIPKIDEIVEIYTSKLDFKSDAAEVGDSEMQHLDFAFASSLVRTFLRDESLFLIIRGRKYTPNFEFFVGNQKITQQSVQTEVDAGYEGREQIVLIEAKGARQKNTIVRQLYYPFRQWQFYTKKKVIPMLFQKSGDVYSFWQFRFKDVLNYNSIELVKAQSFHIIDRKYE